MATIKMTTIFGDNIRSCLFYPDLQCFDEPDAMECRAWWDFLRDGEEGELDLSPGTISTAPGQVSSCRWLRWRVLSQSMTIGSRETDCERRNLFLSEPKSTPKIHVIINVYSVATKKV